MPLDISLSLSRAETHRRHKSLLTALDEVRQPWFTHWRTIAEYYLPRRYPYLLSNREQQSVERRNRNLLSSVSTIAVRTLASGMMNGITSPARPWFRLRIAGFTEESMSHEAKIYLNEVERRMYLILAESNFYDAMAVLYLEWCTFGTASLIIYEDFNDVIRCYNVAVGEFYLAQDDTRRISAHARGVSMTVAQVVAQFGIENVRTETANKYRSGGAQRQSTLTVMHIIEKNDRDDGLLPTTAKFREVYWERGADDGDYLSVKPFQDWPCVTPRWELFGNEAYGTSPAMDALGDTIQLQVLLKKRAQGLAKQLNPPMILDAQMKNRPKALGEGGITYATTSNSNFGAKPAVNVQTPLQEIAYDVQALSSSIRETCHNNLFNMISNLDTVRSAREIEAREGEKLVHLGPVLGRFENEGLDPALSRVFRLAERKGLLPDPPPELAGEQVQVQYVGVLSDAQRAVSTASTERFAQFLAELAPVFPEVTDIPDATELLYDYAEALNVKPSSLKSREEVSEAQAAKAEAEQLQQAAATGGELAQGAKALSETDVGGGMNALQGLMGG